MKNQTKFIVFGFSIFLALNAYSQPMRNGKWEITTELEITGMPMQIPVQRVSICINEKNQNTPPVAVLESCEFHDYKVTSDSASWKMECKEKVRMTGAGSMTFGPSQYKGFSTIKLEALGVESMKMNHIYSGKRIGDC